MICNRDSPSARSLWRDFGLSTAAVVSVRAGLCKDSSTPEGADDRFKLINMEFNDK